MQAVSADSRVSEPNLENPGIPVGLGRNPPHTEVLEKFAQNLADNVIKSLLRQMEMVDPEVTGSNRDQETFAEELASTVMEIALREVCGGCNVNGFQSSKSDGGKTDDEQAEDLAFTDESEIDGDFVNVDAEMDLVMELQTSRYTQPSKPPLSQSGFPVMGSLDYPDAPPTTPLLPELERSRKSFTRKLKGGLAKVFLPSPPPPTPKEKEDDAGSVNSPREELMEHLMHSLSTHDLAREYFEDGAQHGSKIEAFAEALSGNIIDWVLSVKSREQISDDSDLHLLAQQLAQTIISSSLVEAKTPV